MSTVPSAPPPSYDLAVNETNQGAPNTTNNAGGYGTPQHQPGYSYNLTAPQPNTGTQYGQGYQQPPYGQPTDGDPQSGNPQYHDEDVFNAASFSDKAIRNQFIRKVYLILMAQLLFTFAMVAVFVFVEPVKVWVKAHAWIYYISYAVFLITYIALVCCPAVRRKYPGNYIALAVFTFAFTYMCAMIASFYNAQAVLFAAGITVVVTLGISLFACQTKIDFTMCTGLIFAASLVLIVIGFLYLIIFLVIPPGDNGINYYYLQCAYGGIAALILCLFLVFDTQRIVGGKNRRYQLSPEEHIIGAMELYLDIVYLFLIILSFFGGGKD